MIALLTRRSRSQHKSMNAKLLFLLTDLKAYAEQIGKETGKHVEIIFTSSGMVEAVVGDDDVCKCTLDDVVAFLEGKRDVVSPV
jgi:hypothetical protein